MTMLFKKSTPAALLTLITAQSVCAVFFLWDVIADGAELRWNVLTSHFMIEALAALLLIAGVLFELRYLNQLLRRQAHLEKQVSIAAGAFHDIVQDHFDQWGLTPSEQDVANFTIKGMTIAEIAELRGSAEGTVKAHLNGIYKKAGVSGRGGLLSLLIEELMMQPYTSDQGVPT